MRQLKEKKKKLSKEEKKVLKKALKIENENKIGINQFVKVGVFLLFSLAIEITGFALIGLKNPLTGSSQVLPTYIFFDVGIWLFLSGLMLTCSLKWVQNTVFCVSILAQMIIMMGNVTLYEGFGYLFTWDMLLLVTAAAESFDASFVNSTFLAIGFSITAVLIAVPFILDWLLSKYKIVLNKLSKPIFYLISFFVCFVLGVTSYGIQANTLRLAKDDKYTAIASDTYLYENMHIKEEAFRKFGSGGFYLKNLYDLTLAKLDNSKQDELEKWVNSQKVAENQDATLYGDNLIVVMLESFEWFAIDPYTTPNLYKLKTGYSINEIESIPQAATVMTGYHANNKTNVSETSAILGYMPNINTAFFKKNSLATAHSLPNAFNKLDYQTTFFHSWDEAFYDRRENCDAMGFDDFYALKDYKSSNKSTTFGQFNKEPDFASYFMNKIAPTNKKFMTFYTTVSTHGGYNITNKNFEEYYDKYDENKNNVKTWLEENGYKYPTDSYNQQLLRHYKCAAMDTDAFIGKLFEHLHSNNMLDTTTVMMYSDHNAYYHNLSQTIKDTDATDASVLKTHNIPFMIYSKKLGSRIITDFCNSYDLYPTICNLFGLSYSKAFALGVDIFSENIGDSMFMSYLTGFYSSTCYSKNAINYKKYTGSTDNDVEDFKLLICKFYEKLNKLNTIYSRGWSV